MPQAAMQETEPRRLFRPQGAMQETKPRRLFRPQAAMQETEARRVFCLKRQCGRRRLGDFSAASGYAGDGASETFRPQAAMQEGRLEEFSASSGNAGEGGSDSYCCSCPFVAWIACEPIKAKNLAGIFACEIQAAYQIFAE